MPLVIVFCNGMLLVIGFITESLLIIAFAAEMPRFIVFFFFLQNCLLVKGISP